MISNFVRFGKVKGVEKLIPSRMGKEVVSYTTWHVIHKNCAGIHLRVGWAKRLFHMLHGMLLIKLCTDASKGGIGKEVVSYATCHVINKSCERIHLRISLMPDREL